MRTIAVESVSTLPRGRTATFDKVLLDSLKKVKAGQAGVLDEEFAQVPPGEAGKEARAKISASIRKHWKNVYGEDSDCTIRFSPDGFAQVWAKEPKA